MLVTGDERIELPLRVLETPVMPFDQSPVSAVRRRKYLNSITMPAGFVKKKMKMCVKMCVKIWNGFNLKNACKICTKK